MHLNNEIIIIAVAMAVSTDPLVQACTRVDGWISDNLKD